MKLEICSWKTLTDDHVRFFVSSAPNVSRLNLAGSYALTDGSLTFLASTVGANLLSLSLARCPVISDAGMAIILHSTRNLQVLVLDSCTDLTSSTVRAIADCCASTLLELSLAFVQRFYNAECVCLLS